ncbi:hypothetical protein EV178_003054 [Coemansia sp. RSA 1646]|nr:hypothetical protein EV178_003054 [Coemansia sp. RSA 1646]KAJ2089399.1 hypothetical protein IW138_003429 [Coemansia sp. RSA 986]
MSLFYISFGPCIEFWASYYIERRRRKAEKRSKRTQTSVSQYLGSQSQAKLESGPAAAPKPKASSWAALLKSGRNSSAASSSATNGNINNDSTPGQNKFKSLHEALENWSVAFSSTPLQPRGLVNSGNMCFMNVVLQALLYCAPFYNMLWSVKESVAFSFNTTTPLLEALIQFVHEFRHDKTPLAQLETELDEPFVPENVYEALRKKNVFQTLRGQQEDAHEFMSYLVDGIHEEMASVILSQHHTQATKPNTGPCSNQPPATQPLASDKDAGGSDWLEVGPKNKGILVRDTGQSAAKTPITRIFGGALRSTLSVPQAVGSEHIYAQGGKPPQSSNREPFRELSLDISSSTVDTIEEALDELVAPETIEGYMNLLGQPVNVTKQSLFEKAPPVLVFYLKRFVFCHNDGVQKVHKFIEYPQVLTLSPKWFARSAEAAKHKNARYRLCSVIYHHGSHASGGHYTCDLLRSANEWLRFDDVDIGCLSSVDDVLVEKNDRTAYILFYTIC